MAIFAIDFDGTCVTHNYPEIGAPAPHAVRVLRRLVAEGHFLILWTMRSGKRLDEAADYLRGMGVELAAVNTNPDQHTWTNSPKAYAHTYIDDAALGCPLLTEGYNRPVVDWLAVEAALTARGELPPNKCTCRYYPESCVLHHETWTT